MITADHLTKSYEQIKAVDDLSFELKKGQIVGFLGPNGAGKTTTMRLITGYLTPTSGRCFIDGLDISKYPLVAHQKIGYLPESTPLYTDLTVLEYLNYVGSLREIANLKQSLKEVIPLCGLSKVLHQKIQTLSKGYKQRVGLAQALIHKPDVLILDEPTVGLDPNQIIEIRQLIKNLGEQHTVLLSSHILSEVEQTCERVLIISGGHIVAQGSPQELMQASAGLPIFYLGVKDPTALHILKQSSFVESVEAITTQPGNNTIKATLKQGNTDGALLFNWAVENKIVLTELKKEDINLETVFKELTK